MATFNHTGEDGCGEGMSGLEMSGKDRLKFIRGCFYGSLFQVYTGIVYQNCGGGPCCMLRSIHQFPSFMQLVNIPWDKAGPLSDMSGGLCQNIGSSAHQDDSGTSFCHGGGNSQSEPGTAAGD